MKYSSIVYKRASNAVGWRRSATQLSLAICGAALGLGCSAGTGDVGDDEPASVGEAADVDSASVDDGSAPEDDLVAPSTQLAAFELDSGKTARFFHTIDDGIIYEEIGPEFSSPTFMNAEEDVGTLDLFLRLAPPDTPVPEALVRLAGDGAVERIGTRQLVDTLETPITVAPIAPGLDTLGEDHDVGSWNCGNSASDFESFACNGSGASVEACDSGQWWNLQRSSGSKFKKSLGIMAVCGTTVQLRHRYKDCCNWWTVHTTSLPGGFWLWSRYTGGAKWQRRLNYDRIHQISGSYFRAYTAFYN